MRRWRDPLKPQEAMHGLNEVEFMRLAEYNSERARGLVHTEDWKQEMARLQEQWAKGKKEGE